MNCINFSGNRFSYLSDKVKLAMDKANEQLLNHKPISFGSDLLVAAEMEEARNNIAEILNAKAGEIFFSQETLSAEIEIINNLVLFQNVENIITTKFEHPKKIEYLANLHQTGKIKLFFINTTEFGEPDINSSESILSGIKTTSLVTISHANHFTGAMLPVKDVSGICKKYKAFFQLNLNLTIGRYFIDLQKLNPDFACFDSSLINGPVGIGVIYFNEKIETDNLSYLQILKKLIMTENTNLSLIMGFREAFSNTINKLEENKLKIEQLKSYFLNKTGSLSGITHFKPESGKSGLFNSISLFIDKNIYGNYLIENLDLNGICVQEIEYPGKTELFKNHYFINIGLNCDSSNAGIDQFYHIMNNLRIKN